jgi:hypothetical protein
VALQAYRVGEAEKELKRSGSSGRRSHMRSTLLTAFTILAAGNSFAQSEAAPEASYVPAGVLIFPGYTHQFLPTIDTTHGRISKEDGLSITYNLDKYSSISTAADLDEDYVWSRSQQQDDRRLFVALDGDGVLHVKFLYENGGFRPRNGGAMDFVAEFYGSVENDEDIAEFLIMVLGYTR